MIWGRLTYNPQTSDDVFKNLIAKKFPEANSSVLFDAWAKASRNIGRMGELTFKEYENDKGWYPENCSNFEKGFLTIELLAIGVPKDPTKLCGMTATAEGKCSGLTSALVVADKMEADALSALGSVGGMKVQHNTEFGVAVNTIRTMSYLSAYYAYKIRGVVNLKDATKKTPALKMAHCWWIKYSALMDSMYTGMTMQRNMHFKNWHANDAAVLAEYQNHGGGKTTPVCEYPLATREVQQIKKQGEVKFLTLRGLQFTLPRGGVVHVAIVNNRGSVLVEEKSYAGKEGLNDLKFGRDLGKGLYIVRIKLDNSKSVVKKMAVFQ